MALKLNSIALAYFTPTKFCAWMSVSVYLCLHLASQNHSGSDSALISHSDLQMNWGFRQADGI